MGADRSNLSHAAAATTGRGAPFRDRLRRDREVDGDGGGQRRAAIDHDEASRESS